MEPVYQIARLRIMRGLSQEELAKKVGTKQSNISRLETGRQKPSLSLLERLAEALDARLQVSIVSTEAVSSRLLE